MSTPTLGRIVHYRLTQADVDYVRSRRDAADAVALNSLQPAGQGGNPVAPGQLCTALVVASFPVVFVNLRVLLDGPDDLWVPSVAEGFTAGTWAWPGRVA